MNDRSWSLPSNRGMESLECAVVGDAGRDLVCRLTIVGEYWKRAGVTQEVVEDFRVLLPQVLVSREALGRLEQHFAGWLKEERPFSCTLQPDDSGGQVLEVSMGDDARFIRAIHKPIFTLHYCSGLVMRSSFSFQVDQSCVRIAMEGIANCLCLQEC